MQVAPDEHSIYLENPDNGYLLPLDTPRRGIDPSPWVGSSSVIVHFGPPDGGAHERGLGDLYFGSVTIVGATIGDITTSDFIFG